MFNTSENKKKLDQEGLQQAISPSPSTTAHSSSTPGLPHPSFQQLSISSHPNLLRALSPPGCARNTDLLVVLGRQQASKRSSWSNPNRLSSPTLKDRSAVFYTTTSGEKLTPSQVSIMFFLLDHMQIDCLYPWTSH